jgi:hypothetical protein
MKQKKNTYILTKRRRMHHLGPFWSSPCHLQPYPALLSFACLRCRCVVGRSGGFDRRSGRRRRRGKWLQIIISKVK